MNPLIFLLAASLVEVAACIVGLGGTHGYALCVGIVSASVATLLWVLQANKPEMCAKPLVVLKDPFGTVSVEMAVALFLFAWWSVGTGIMTFRGPFTATTNGYFATWAALWSTLLLIGATMPDVAWVGPVAKQKLRLTGGDSGPLYVFVICSVMVLCAAASILGSWESQLALVLAAVGLTYGCAMLCARDKLSESAQKNATLAVVLVWAIEACICTFRAPFVLTGNGYFASWLGLLAIGIAAMPHLPISITAKSAGFRTSQASFRDSTTDAPPVEIKIEPGAAEPQVPPPEAPPPEAPPPEAPPPEAPPNAAPKEVD